MPVMNAFENLYIIYDIKILINKKIFDKIFSL